MFISLAISSRLLSLIQSLEVEDLSFILVKSQEKKMLKVKIIFFILSVVFVFRVNVAEGNKIISM